MLPRESLAESALLAVPGVATAWFVLRSAPPPRIGSAPVGWMLVGVWLVRRPDVVSTLQTAVNQALGRRSAALGLVLARWWLGWHFITGG